VWARAPGEKYPPSPPDEKILLRKMEGNAVQHPIIGGRSSKEAVHIALESSSGGLHPDPNG
jgi:hypothetical protein